MQSPWPLPSRAKHPPPSGAGIIEPPQRLGRAGDKAGCRRAQRQKRLFIDRSEKRVVDYAYLLAKTIEPQSTGRRDAKQHHAAVERVGALEEEASPHQLASFGGDECAGNM